MVLALLMTSCYYGVYTTGYSSYTPTYSTTRSYYSYSYRPYYNTYREVYAPINCRNGLNQYEVLRVYPNRDGRPFNLKYDHYY